MDEADEDREQPVIEKVDDKPRFYWVDWVRSTAVGYVIIVHSIWQALEGVEFDKELSNPNYKNAIETK